MYFAYLSFADSAHTHCGLNFNGLTSSSVLVSDGSCSKKRLSAVCCIHYEPLSLSGAKRGRWGAMELGRERAASMRFALVTNAPYSMAALVLLLILLLLAQTMALATFTAAFCCGTL